MQASIAANDPMSGKGAATSCADPRTAIEVFRERVRAQFGSRLRYLRLYGSAARGDEHEESDIDILVLLDDAD